MITIMRHYLLSSDHSKYLLGVISTSDNTMILKNAAVIEKMKVKYADDIKEWEEHFTYWKIFK